MVWTGPKRSLLAMLVFLAATVAALSVAPARAAGAWRAFTPASPWNVPAAH